MNLITLSIPVSAKPIEETKVDESSTRAIGPCPIHGTHQMSNTGNWVTDFFYGSDLYDLSLF